MAKSKINSDGERQTDFLNVATRRISYEEVDVNLKLAELIGIIKAGDADFARYLPQERKWKFIAQYKTAKQALWEGEFYDVIQARGLVIWAERWSNTRAALVREVEMLRNSIKSK